MFFFHQCFLLHGREKWQEGTVQVVAKVIDIMSCGHQCYLHCASQWDTGKLGGSGEVVPYSQVWENDTLNIFGVATATARQV